MVNCFNLIFYKNSPRALVRTVSPTNSLLSPSFSITLWPVLKHPYDMCSTVYMRKRMNCAFACVLCIVCVLFCILKRSIYLTVRLYHQIVLFVVVVLVVIISLYVIFILFRQKQRLAHIVLILLHHHILTNSFKKKKINDFQNEVLSKSVRNSSAFM